MTENSPSNVNVPEPAKPSKSGQKPEKTAKPAKTKPTASTTHDVSSRGAAKTETSDLDFDIKVPKLPAPVNELNASFRDMEHKLLKIAERTKGILEQVFPSHEMDDQLPNELSNIWETLHTEKGYKGVALRARTCSRIARLLVGASEQAEKDVKYLGLFHLGRYGRVREKKMNDGQKDDGKDEKNDPNADDNYGNEDGGSEESDIELDEIPEE